MHVPQICDVSLRDVPGLSVGVFEELPHLGVRAGVGGHSQNTP